MKHFGSLALLGAVLAASSSSAFATLLTPGTMVVPGTVASGSAGVAISPVISLSSPGVVNISDPVPFIATYTEQVFRGGTSPEVFCPTCVNFVINFQNTGAGTDPILQLSTTSFDSFLTRVDYVNGLGVAPATATRTLNGQTINFQYGAVGVQPGSAPGSTTDTLVIFTNGTSYTNGVISFQDGTTSLPSAAYVPANAPVPEPNSLMLLGTGLVSAAGMLLRRRATA